MQILLEIRWDNEEEFEILNHVLVPITRFLKPCDRNILHNIKKLRMILAPSSLCIMVVLTLYFDLRKCTLTAPSSMFGTIAV